MIGGGLRNGIDTGANYSTIGGGYENYISKSYCFIGGGGGPYAGGPPLSAASPSSSFSMRVSRMAMHSSSVITFAPRWSNIATAPWTTIGGGYNNLVADTLASILGGGYNMNYGYASSIGGGAYHQIYSNFGSIGGGNTNAIDVFSDNATIAGGILNYVGVTGSTVGGGSNNNILDSNATIAGGFSNTIFPGAPYASIPGGNNLIAQSYAQTVVGYNNNRLGSVTQGTSHFWSPTNLGVDAPLFIVGNGVQADSLSNAAEFSYDGHLQLYDVNGNTHPIPHTSPRTPYLGATYQDNTVIAWGDVQPNSITGPPADAQINSDFGVVEVQNPYNGVYIVKVALNLPDGTTPVPAFVDCSITATIQESLPTYDTVGPFPIKTISCSEFQSNVGPTEFVVRTYVSLPSGAAGCELQDLPFFLKVCARKGSPFSP